MTGCLYERVRVPRMNGPKHRVRRLQIVFAASCAVSAAAACSSSSGESEFAEANRAAWVVVDGALAPEIADFLEPNTGRGSRIVVSQDERAILRVREGEIDTLGTFFHD